MATEKKIIEVTVNMQQAKSEFDALNLRYKEAIQKAKDLAAANGLFSKSAQEAAMQANALGRQINEINKSMAMGKTDLQSFVSGLTIMPGILGQFGFALQRVGVILNGVLINPVFRAIALIGSLVFVIGALVKSTIDFNFEMAKVKAMSSATAEEFKNLKETAIQVGKETMRTAVEVAKLQVELAKLGFAATDINKMTRAITQLSIATDEQLAPTAEVVGGVIRAFGFEASQTQRVVDVMAKSFMTSALNLQRFRLAMTYVGPVARQTGLSFEETTAVMGALANNMIVGSKTGTALRRIFIELSNTSGTFQERLKQLANSNFTVADAEDEVGKYAMTALTALVNMSDFIPEYTKSLENAAGASEKMAAIMQDTLKGDILILKSAWESFTISVADGEGIFSVVSRKFIQFLTEMVNGLNQASRWISNGFKLIWEGLIYGGDTIIATTMSIVESFKLLGDVIGGRNLKDAVDTFKKNINNMWDVKNWSISAYKINEEIKETEKNIRKLNTALLSPEEQKAFNDRQNVLKKYILTEKEILKSTYQEEKDDLLGYLQNQTITKEEYNKGLLNIEKEYNDKLKKLNKDAVKETINFGLTQLMELQNRIYGSPTEDSLLNRVNTEIAKIFEKTKKTTKEMVIETNKIADDLFKPKDFTKADQSIDKKRLQFLESQKDLAAFELQGAEALGAEMFNLKLSYLEAEKAAELEIARQKGEDTTAIEKYYSQQKKAIKMDEANFYLSASVQIANGIAALMKEGSDEQKLASAIAVGLQQTQSAFKTGALAYEYFAAGLIPQGIFATLQTAAVIAEGYAAINKIYATDTGNPNTNKSASSVTGSVTEKFHTGTYRPATQTEEKEITRTLLTTERVLSPAQTGIFDSIINRVQSYGGASSITSDVGVSNVMQAKMIEIAMSKALRNMPAPVMSWSEFQYQADRMRQLEQNKFIR